MKITISLLLATLIFSLTANNANSSTVIGTISCEQWLNAQSKPSDGEAYTVWLNGYLSGANAMYGEMVDRDFIKNSDQISIIDWTNAYCKKYPKSMLHDSANALVKLLKRDFPF